MTQRIQVARSSTVRLYHTNVKEVDGSLSAYGERIGLKVDALPRIDVMRAAWRNLSRDLSALADDSKGPIVPSWMHQVRSAGLVFFESSRREHYCTWMVNSSDHLCIEHLEEPGRVLTLDLDRGDYEDMHVTFYRSYALRPGEAIAYGDRGMEPESKESYELPVQWVGLPYDPAAHGQVRRTPQPTLLSLMASDDLS